MSATILACTSADNKTGSSTTTTTDTLNKEEITARIKGIEEDWNKANLGADHSYKFSEDILADDFLGHNDKAVMQNKEEYLKDLAAANYTVTNITNTIFSNIKTGYTTRAFSANNTSTVAIINTTFSG